MRLIRGLQNLSSFEGRCVATIGNFDGVHLGHKVILDQVKREASLRNVPSVAMIFEPQPREFFQGDKAPSRLQSFRDKLVALAAEHIDVVVCLQFNQRFRSLSADQFIRSILVDALHIEHLVIGDDFRFGCDRTGSFELLEQNGLAHNYSVERTDTIEVQNLRVSSTRVRQSLNENNLTLAAELLGRPYSISGTVAHGRKLGRKLNAPTANIYLGSGRPALCGVFAVQLRVNSRRNAKVKSFVSDAGRCDTFPGVANIGYRPTVDGVRPALEVHLLDFSGDLYGAHVEVTFLQHLRDEQKFERIEDLQQQIGLDIEQARQFFISRSMMTENTFPAEEP
ncbi:riboflavin biosynthesis protein RibF [Oleiphilus messinensis]|uniref:Riboflavin biosynthesis protein n=1 Tax=Oleiphilus messinensis TaxID=141451 RepID=A0A1Y0I688_9GAMM|nr:bifunctional riboflavin kinase/FAD synthetase [Oleiphilus messinensis]ARU54913.1 riboflavin biosynthesis protein RibF [Oleiphilus messinensis]